MTDDKHDDDDAERDANGDRLPVDQDKRQGGGTLADILAVTQANAARMAANQARADAELEIHRQGCGADECRTCGRLRCPRCEIIKQGPGLCAACRERETFERAKKRVFASIPKRYRWASDVNLTLLAERVRLSPDRISAALAWAAGLEASPPSLALMGVTGAGKTSLAVALFATWFARHRDESAALFVPAIELGLARSRHPLGHDDPPAVLAAIRAPLLILDDLGAEAPAHSEVMRQVMHRRHNDDLPTWITTGISQRALVDRYDGGLARRLFEQTKLVTLGDAA